METRSRFSVAKAQRFLVYSRVTSTRRQAAVVCLFPIPGLLAALLLSLIPLQRPSLRAPNHWGFFTQVYVINWLWMVSGMAQARAFSTIPHTVYPTRAIAWIATIAAAPCVAVYFLVGCLWRFPVPFFPMATLVPFMISLLVAHAAIFRGGRLPAAIRAQLRVYLPSLGIQVAQLVIYPLYSALFVAANDWQQLLLVLLFPGIKHALRRALFIASRHAPDCAKVEAVAGVEISASIYQALIMQTTPAAWVTVVIIALDVLFGVVVIRRYMDRTAGCPTHEIIARTTEMLEKTAIQNDELRTLETHTTTRHPTIKAAFNAVIPEGSDSPAAVHAVPSHDPAHSKTDADKLTTIRALEMLQAAETILLVEFLEVMVPVAVALYLTVASQLASAKYNVKLRPFSEDPASLTPALASVLLYTGLQGITFIALCVVMRARYRLSALALLAFVLETHAWSLQGKAVMWLSGTAALPVDHYGMDFTFKFVYA